MYPGSWSLSQTLSRKDNDIQNGVNDNVITATSIMKILGMHIDSQIKF